MRRVVVVFYSLVLVVFLAGCLGGTSKTPDGALSVSPLKVGMSRISVAREAGSSFFSLQTQVYVAGKLINVKDSGDSETLDVYSGQVYFSVKTNKYPGAFKFVAKVKPGVHYFFKVASRTKNYNANSAFSLFGKDAAISQNLGPYQVSAVGSKRLVKEEDASRKFVYKPAPAVAAVDVRDAQFKEIQADLRRRKDSNAYKRLLPLAESGHADSQFALSNLYLMGITVDKNTKMGLKWLQKASDQGHVDAMGLLSDFYLNGSYIKKNLVEALNLKVEAALSGDALSQYNLATLYLNKEMGFKNLFEAIRFLQAAAEQNLQLAQYNLGAIYMNGQGGAVDLIKAYQWFYLAGNRNVQGKRSIMVLDSLDVAGGAQENVTVLEGKMSEAQLVKARTLVSQWKPR